LDESGGLQVLDQAVAEIWRRDPVSRVAAKEL
jgi:hypothetical protein